ncbi:imidazoleglycerol-phosphate dehydratase HisB [soil metagenome]
MSANAPGVRYAEIYRETAETRIEATLDFDGDSRRDRSKDIKTGIGFFDHMLQQLAFHGNVALGLQAEGDLHIDDHHTIEDCGIVLGQAISEALAGDEPIVRYASNHTPMDEALVLCAIDVSGRGILGWNVEWKREEIGDMATECVREFFRALAVNARITLHIHKIAGENDHHVCEAIFKAFGRALNEATRQTDRRKGTSTKGKRD